MKDAKIIETKVTMQEYELMQEISIYMKDTDFTTDLEDEILGQFLDRVFTDMA